MGTLLKKYKPSYTNKILDLEFSDAIINIVLESVEKWTELLKNRYTTDSSVYSGYAGLCLALMKLKPYLNYAKRFDTIKTIDRAITEALNPCYAEYQPSDEHSPSFLTGPGGAFSILAVHLYQQKRLEDSHRVLNYVTVHPLCIPDKANPSLLNGLAGYLDCLLFTCHNTYRGFINPDALEEICSHILSSINLTVEPENMNISVIDGMVGILYGILDPLCVKLKPVVKDFKSIASFIGRILNHYSDQHPPNLEWRSGLSSAIFLAIRASRAFQKPVFLQQAEEFAKKIFKNYSETDKTISSGVAGFGYAFLALYHYTKNPDYLYYATKFGDDIVRTQIDDSCALFEGSAGTVCYLADLSTLSLIHI